MYSSIGKEYFKYIKFIFEKKGRFGNGIILFEFNKLW